MRACISISLTQRGVSLSPRSRKGDRNYYVIYAMRLRCRLERGRGTSADGFLRYAKGWERGYKFALPRLDSVRAESCYHFFDLYNLNKHGCIFYEISFCAKYRRIFKYIFCIILQKMGLTS